jgi:hypothetical protein
VPSFLADIWNSYGIARDTLRFDWTRLPVSTRVVVTLAVICGMLYFGSKADKTGWSVFLFVGSFALFSYVLVLGFSTMR